MISREMAQDPSISPKAKGILLYLLSLPADWKIYHSQLQKGLNVGEDYLNSAIDELLENGYAERTRQRVKGIFQPYSYKIREFKKCSPNRENRPGSSGPENPDLQSNEYTPSYEGVSTKETTTTAAAAPLQQKEKQQQHFKIHECLKSIDIPEVDKLWITEHYTEDVIKHAIAWSQHPDTKINKGLSQALKWACANKPEIPKKPEDIEEANKKLAYETCKNLKIPPFIKIEILSKSIEINYLGCQKDPSVIKFSEKSFKEELLTILARNNIKLG